MEARCLARHEKETLLQTHLADLYVTLTDWQDIPPEQGVALRDQLAALLLGGDSITHEDLCRIIPIEQVPETLKHGEKKRSIAEIMHGRQADRGVAYRGVLSVELTASEAVQEAITFAKQNDIARFRHDQKVSAPEPVTQPKRGKRESHGNDSVLPPRKKRPEPIKRTRHENGHVSPDTRKKPTVKKQDTAVEVRPKASAWQEDFEDIEQLAHLGEQRRLKKHLDTVLKVEARIVHLQQKKQPTLKTASPEFRQLEALVKRWMQLNPEKSVRARDELERCLMASKRIGYLKVSEPAAIVGLSHQRPISGLFQELIDAGDTWVQPPLVSVSPSPQQDNDSGSDADGEDSGYGSLEDAEALSGNDSDSDDEELTAVYQNYARVLDEDEEGDEDRDALGELINREGELNSLSRLAVANQAEVSGLPLLNSSGAIDEDREEKAFRQLLEKGRPPTNMHPSHKEVERGSFKKDVSLKAAKTNQAHWVAVDKLERVIIMTMQQAEVMTTDTIVEGIEKRWSKALYRKAACRVLEEKTGQRLDADNVETIDDEIAQAINSLEWDDYESEYRDALVKAVEAMAWETFCQIAESWEKIPLPDDKDFSERKALFQWLIENIENGSLTSVRDFYHSRGFGDKIDAIKQRLSAP